MEKIITLISIAIILGVTAMLIPISALLAFPQFFKVETNYNGLNQQQESNFTVIDTQKFVRTAKMYGKIDAELEPISLSLYQITLIVTTSFIVAFGFFFFFKNKISK